MAVAKIDRSLAVAQLAAALAALIALVVIGVRAVVRFDGDYDSLWYHLPFAARRAGLDLPYEMNLRAQHYYEGFPPLAEFVQGVLWRITGSMNATGVVNYLAFGGFLAYCGRVLRVRFWLVALIALTAPIVVIHATSSYIDLFSNSFLAVAAASSLYLVLCPERATRAIAIGGLAGAAGAAWSKLQLAPLAGLLLIVVAVLGYRRRTQLRLSRRRWLAIAVFAAMVAAAPYAKNAIVYGNPVWPVRAPLIGDSLPYAIDAIREGSDDERPSMQKDSWQATVFVRSLFEIGFPPRKPRWDIAEGGPGESFRMGGFWGFGALFYLVASFAMFVVHDRRRGLVAIAGSIGVLGVLSVLPQSNELRYYMFVPLAWAAGFAMTYPSLCRRAPRIALAMLVAVLAMFGYMVHENRSYYVVESRGFDEVIRDYSVARVWSHLRPGVTYCGVGVEPYGILFTGPTLHEFSIVDRKSRDTCPKGSIEISPNHPPGTQLADDSRELFAAGRYAEAADAARQAIAIDPTNDILAWKIECAALARLERWAEAVPSCERAVALRTNGSTAYLALARAHLAKP